MNSNIRKQYDYTAAPVVVKVPAGNGWIDVMGLGGGGGGGDGGGAGNGGGGGAGAPAVFFRLTLSALGPDLWLRIVVGQGGIGGSVMANRAMPGGDGAATVLSVHQSKAAASAGTGELVHLAFPGGGGGQIPVASPGAPGGAVPDENSIRATLRGARWVHQVDIFPGGAGGQGGWAGAKGSDGGFVEGGAGGGGGTAGGGGGGASHFSDGGQASNQGSRGSGAGGGGENNAGGGTGGNGELWLYYTEYDRSEVQALTDQQANLRSDLDTHIARHP